MAHQGKKKRVAVFGAGVTGLTVAHELVERGFEVHVYEKDRVIGGMAATQYSTHPTHGCEPVECEPCQDKHPCPTHTMTRVARAGRPLQVLAFSTPEEAGTTRKPHAAEASTLLVGGSVGISVWRVDTGRRVATFGDREEITAVAIDTNERWIATGDQRGHVKIWDLKKRKRVACHRPEGNPGQVHSVGIAFDADIQTITAVATYSQCEVTLEVNLLAMVDGTGCEPSQVPVAHWQPPQCAQVGTAFAYKDQTFELCPKDDDPALPRRTFEIPELPDAVAFMDVAPDGRFVAFGDQEGHVMVAQIDGDDLRIHQGPLETSLELRSVHLLGGNKVVLLRYQSGLLEWRDFDDLSVVLQSRDLSITSLFEDFRLQPALMDSALSEDDRLYAAGYSDGSVALWSVEGEQIWLKPVGEDSVQPRALPGIQAQQTEQDTLLLRTGMEAAYHFVGVSSQEDRLLSVIFATDRQGQLNMQARVWEVSTGTHQAEFSNTLTELLAENLSELPSSFERVKLSLSGRSGSLTIDMMLLGNEKFQRQTIGLAAKTRAQTQQRPVFQNAAARQSDCDPCKLLEDPCLQTTALVAMDDGTTLVGRVDGSVRWSLGSMDAPTLPHGTVTAVDAIAHTQNGRDLVQVALGHEDGTLLWLTYEKLTNTLSGSAPPRLALRAERPHRLHDGPITALTIIRNPSDSRNPVYGIVTGGQDRRLRGLDLVNNAAFSLASNHEGPITSIVYRKIPMVAARSLSFGALNWRSSYEVAVGSRDIIDRDNTVKLWDLSDGMEILTYEPHPWKPLPGEHGFRFFPAFYRHVFDTMERTRLRADRHRTQADNMVATTNQGIALQDGLLSFEFVRKREPSVEATIRTVHQAMAGLGYTYGDIERFKVKTLQFMTACSARRQTYEEISWWDFVEAERFSPQTQQALNTVPRVLVAMDAIRGDALTQGLVMLQLLMDQGSDGEHTDRVLNGPSSEAWFNHWQDYLEDRGVHFHLNTAIETLLLDSSRGDIKGAMVRPQPLIPQCCQDPRPAHMVQADFFVLAIPMRAAQALVRRLIRDHQHHWSPPAGGDLDQLYRYNVPNSEAWMSGIQYYLRNDVPIVRGGHIYYPDSPWGLSSVSQAQFWDRQLELTYGVRGVVSVVVGDWEKPVPLNPPGAATKWWHHSQVPGKTARQCTPDELAREVWRQINLSANGQDLIERREVRGRTDLPEPLYYHLDDDLNFDGPLIETRRRYLISPVGQWKHRPGRLNATEGYELQTHNLVLAGNFMKTFTRLTTMESANESGRHAANAILSSPRACFDGERCAIYPLERWEPADAIAAKRLDKLLFDAGLPHMFDILRLMDVVDTWTPDHPRMTLTRFANKHAMPPTLRSLLLRYAERIDAFYREVELRPRDGDLTDHASALISLINRFLPLGSG